MFFSLRFSYSLILYIEWEREHGWEGEREKGEMKEGSC